MNKINVKQLLRVSKNTQRVPLQKVDGTIMSSIPSDNIKVDGRDITIYGSSKNVDLNFVQNNGEFVSSTKPVNTTVKPSDLSANLVFNNDSATFKFTGVSPKNNAELDSSQKGINLGSMNNYNDALYAYNKDNGLEFIIHIPTQRDEFSYTFEFTMNDSIKPQLKGKGFVLKDDTGKEKFSISDILIVNENGKVSTIVQNSLTENGTCKLVANSDFINENIRSGIMVFLVFKVCGNVSQTVKLETFKDGQIAFPLDDVYVFGYRYRKEFMLRATINANDIANELISRQSENFETMFTLNFKNTKAKNYNEGFMVYDGDDNNLIKKQNFNSQLSSISVDITNKVKTAIETVNSGKKAKDIVLEFKYSCSPVAISDDEYAGDTLADNYVEIYGVYSQTYSLRPRISSKFVSIGEVKSGTPFIERELGRSGKSKINVFEKSLQHGFSLGSVAAKSFRIPFNMFYDSRLLTQKFERPNTVGLPKGWMFNLSQCLIKNRTNVNKTKGVKEVLYVDGDNNTHILKEKWFYKDENGKEIIVSKEEVFLGNDQKLKWKAGKNIIHDVNYQVDSDDGLTFISTNSKINYAKQSDMKMNQTFTLVSADGSKKYGVYKNKNGKVKVTFFRNGNANNGITYKEVFPEYAEATMKKFTATKILSIKDVYFVDGKAYEKGCTPTNELISTQIECELLYKDGKYFVCGIDTLYEALFAYETSTVDAVAVDSNNSIIELECTNNIDVASDTDIPDYYENEDIANVSSQIKQCEDYIKELQDQCDSYSNSISSLNAQLTEQTALNYLNSSATDYQEKIAKINEKYVNFNDKTDTQNYKLYSEQSRDKSQLYQKRSYEYQVSSIKRQIDGQNASLQKLYEKISDYQVQLNNLYELKESYIKAEKDNVQDYVFDKDGNLLGFDYYGKLVYISDRYENEIRLSYVDNKLIEIYSDKQKIVLHYNKDNLLDYVIDATGRKTKFNISNSTVVVKKLDQNGKFESTTFAFDSKYRLTSIVDQIKQSFTYTWDDFMVSSITSKSAVASISELGIEEKDEQVLSTTTIESTGYCIKVKYEESNTCDIYYLNYDGKLIEKIYHDEDDETKDTVSIDCYEKDNHVLELEYETKNLVGEVDLLGDDTTTINKTIKFGKDGIDISKFSNREMFAISIDFSDVDESQIENNIVKFDLNVDGVEKICTFNKIPYKVLAVPALIKDLNGSVEINVTFSKNINLNSLKKIYIYRCDATINEYNEDEHLVCSITRDNDIVFEDYDGDNPTSCITTDRYGITKTSKALFDASGRTIYEEDGDGNCKETYYDEKGNIIETREYNKNNSSLAKVSKTKYDDDGNAVEIDGLMRDKNGKYPQKKTTYLSGTDVVSSVIYPNGQVIAYGYDFNTGLLTEKASDANGQNNATQYGYIANYLISLAHHGVKFNYTLDNKGRKLSTKLNDQEIISTKYEDNYTDSSITNGEKVTTTFANGFESVTISDKDGDLISTNTNDGDSLVYEYDDRDRLVKVDHNSGTDTVVTTYDLYDKIVSNEYKCKNQTIKEDISYDDHGRVASKTETADDILTTTTFIYCDGKDNLVEEISIGDTKQKFEYDALGRTVRKELTHLDNTLIEESFEYLRYGENSLNLVKEHDVQVGGVISDTTEYEYDVAGNITLVKRDEFETCYKYDELGRLIREDNPNLNKTIIYKYDTGGNILLKKEYQYSLENRLYSPNIISYTYASKGYKDQLINFNGEAISYDIMGRPTSIGSHNLSWDKKGNLIGYDETTYTYSFDGTRISKTINGVKTSYVVLGGKILAEKSEDKDIIYRYSSDKLVGFSYNGVEYIYERNIQGDILRIYQRDNLTLVAEYNYDAYGNHEIKEITEANIGHINPFRYRGYYFDAESGWYHLNTRYYSPLMGRFISPDDLSILDETKSQINGLNLYMYCGDNPVMNIDPSGQSWWSDFWSGVGGIVVGVVVSAAEIVAGIALICTGYGIGLGAGLLSTGIGSLISGSMNALNGGSFIAGWTGGQVSGLISTVFSLAIPTFGDYVGGAIGSFVGTAVSGYIDRALGYNSLTDGQIFLNASISSFLSIVTTFAISGFNNTINPNLGLSLSRTTGPTRSTIINNLIFGFINGIFPAIYEDVFFKLNMTRKRQN